jgi:hypothetical protein
MDDFVTPGKSHSVPFKPLGVWLGIVTRYTHPNVWVTVPRLTGPTHEYPQTLTNGRSWAVATDPNTGMAVPGQVVAVQFLEGQADSLVIMGPIRSINDPLPGTVPPPSAAGTTGGSPGSGTAPDGTLSIMGPNVLTGDHLNTWWDAHHAGQPPRLAMPIHQVMALYLSEGAAEGVRGDVALAQAFNETGYFTNQDTSLNNFAGIGHYDNAASGNPFAGVETGVRAQIQLLKKVALGNNVALANPNVAPSWGGRQSGTWGGLSGNWASATDYWQVVSSIYASMGG